MMKKRYALIVLISAVQWCQASQNKPIEIEDDSGHMQEVPTKVEEADILRGFSAAPSFQAAPAASSSAAVAAVVQNRQSTQHISRRSELATINKALDVAQDLINGAAGFARNDKLALSLLDAISDNKKASAKQRQRMYSICDKIQMDPAQEAALSREVDRAVSAFFSSAAGIPLTHEHSAAIDEWQEHVPGVVRQPDRTADSGPFFFGEGSNTYANRLPATAAAASSMPLSSAAVPQANLQQISAVKGTPEWYAQQLKLGHQYYYGSGGCYDSSPIARNYGKARFHLMQANDPKAPIEVQQTARETLGLIMKEGGFGVEKNFKEAVDLFTQAIKNGLSKPMQRRVELYLGFMYFIGGYGIDKNYKKAMQFANQVIESGIEDQYSNIARNILLKINTVPPLESVPAFSSSSAAGIPVTHEQLAAAAASSSSGMPALVQPQTAARASVKREAQQECDEDDQPATKKSKQEPQ